MDTGAFFLASLAGMFFGTIVLALVLLALHRLGFAIGKRAAPNRPVWVGIVKLGVAAWAPSLWPLVIDLDGFMRAGTILATYVAIAFPLSMGYGAARDLAQRESRRRWRKNADDWLGVWECEVAPVSSEDEDGG